MSQATLPDEKKPGPAHAAAPGADVPFSSNEMRLTPRQWLIAIALLVVLFAAIPAAWDKVEPFAPGPAYRIPYSLGEDYWQFNRYCRQVAGQEATVLLGDSVVWGHYVRSEEALSQCLSRQSKQPFLNLGVDGVHPAALVGLIEYYAGPISGRRVILQCNPLWMSSKQHDLQTDKQFAFQHPRLVPQFASIPCYQETLANRLSIVVDRNLSFFGWANHLRSAYFGNRDVQNWTLDHPYRNPLSAVTGKLASPDEEPNPPPGDQPWTKRGGGGKAGFAWVDLEQSFQWRSFRQALKLLQDRGNRVFVLVGPFNEHMLKEASLRKYLPLKAGIDAWLTEQGIPHFVPDVLPSELYADASHPLREGYDLLAQKMLQCPAFQEFQGKE